MTSWAEIRAGVALSESGTSGRIRRGDHPVLSWNGENPVDAFTVFMIAKQMCGRVARHPF